MNRIRRAMWLAASAGAVLLGGAALLTGLGAEPARAAPSHVAIVIAGDKTACVAWHSGITGDEVLNDVASVTYRQDGLIIKIDGRPSDGYADDTHYWAYWHNNGTGWEYSGEGASSYNPKAGSVEGWAYGNKAQPAQISYSSICQDATQAPPPPPPTTTSSARSSPAPAPTTTHAPPATSSATPAPPPPSPVTTYVPPTPMPGSMRTRVTASHAPARTKTCPPPTAQPSASAPASTSISTSTHTKPSPTPTSTKACPSPTAHRSTTVASRAVRPSTVDTPQPASVLPSPAASKRRNDGPNGPAIGTAIGLAAVAAIGGAAYWRMRREGGD